MTDNIMTDNMKLWDAVSKTDPKHTKPVNQRGGFTAIDAHYQIQQATEAFGPVGIGWGYDAGAPIFTPEGLIIIPVTLWHGEPENRFGPQYGCSDMSSKRLDTDAPKKAETDAITKLLSHLGFNADVFLGKFDDNKYVAQMEREFAEKVPTITEDQRTELMALLNGLNMAVEPILAKARQNTGQTIKDLSELPASEYDGLAGFLKMKSQKENT